MAVFGDAKFGDAKFVRQPPEMTGAQGFGTPDAQKNAVVQGLGGAPSSPSGDAKGQSPADKLLSYASNFGTPMPMSNAMQPDVLSSPVNTPDPASEDIAKQLFTTPDLTASGATAGGPMPWSAAPSSDASSGDVSPWSSTPSPGMGVLPGETPSDPNGGYVAPRFDPDYQGIAAGQPTLTRELPAFPSMPAEPSRTRAVAPTTPQAAFTDQQLADHYKTGQPFTPEMQAVLDQRNPRPPQGTENPVDAAAWYRGFAFIDPAFASITEADVTNQRMLATSGKFAAMGHPEWNDIARWVLAGRPGGQYNDPGATGGDPNGGYVAPRIQPSYDPNTGVVTYPGANVPPPASPPQPPAPSPSSGTGDSGSKGTAPAAPPVAPPPPPGGAQPGPSAPWTPTWGDLGAAPDLPPIPMPDVSNDPWTQMLQKALGAQKDVADAQIRRSVTAAQAATGGLNMGGFGSAIATPIAEYNANLDKEGATQLTAAHNSAMDRALQGSIAERQSQTQLQLGRMDVMSKKYSADQSLEGEKFRAQIDQAIGAAQNASAEKISTAVNAKDLQTARIAADSAAQIAASNAASGAAQAGASLAAQQYASNMAYQGTIQKIAQERENSQLQYNLGITGIGNDAYKANLQNNQFMMALLQGLGPEQLAKYLFPNQQPPTPVYVQP